MNIYTYIYVYIYSLVQMPFRYSSGNKCFCWLIFAIRFFHFFTTFFVYSQLFWFCLCSFCAFIFFFLFMSLCRPLFQFFLHLVRAHSLLPKLFGHEIFAGAVCAITFLLSRFYGICVTCFSSSVVCSINSQLYNWKIVHSKCRIQLIFNKE